MSPKRRPVLLLGPAADPQLDAVGRALAARGVPHVKLDGATLDQGTPCTWTAQNALLGTLDLLNVHAVYVRQIPLAWPPLGTRDDTPVVLAGWMTPYMLSREREAFWRAVLMAWKDRGIRVLNPPVADRVAQNKPHQLDVARRLGVPVPETCITNDIQALRAFCRKHGDVAVKPLDGGALTQRLGSTVPRAMQRALAAAPVIAQRFIPGDDVRLYMLGNRVLSCARIVLKAPADDFRADPDYQAGRALYERVNLPGTLLGKATAWMRACGLVFAGLDLKRAPGGAFTFLEMNSSPIFMDQQDKTGDDLAGGLAGWLAAPRRLTRRS